MKVKKILMMFALVLVCVVSAAGLAGCGADNSGGGNSDIAYWTFYSNQNVEVTCDGFDPVTIQAENLGGTIYYHINSDGSITLKISSDENGAPSYMATFPAPYVITY